MPRGYATAKTADEVLLATRLEEYGASVHRCGESEVSALLGRLIEGTVVVPDGLPKAFLPQGPALLRDPLTYEQLDAADAVVTTCAVAVCDTGTLVLDGSGGMGRRALTLLPDRHVVVVTPDVLVGSIPEALRRLDPRRPLTWISGPSATSDIELERIEGVHGPRRLEAIIVQRGKAYAH